LVKRTATTSTSVSTAATASTTGCSVARIRGLATAASLGHRQLDRSPQLCLLVILILASVLAATTAAPRLLHFELRVPRHHHHLEAVEIHHGQDRADGGALDIRCADVLAARACGAAGPAD
jgi:hypothetical protein